MPRKALPLAKQAGQAGQRHYAVNLHEMTDPDDFLTREQGDQIAKARREVAEGSYITLDELRSDPGESPSPLRR